MNPHSHFACICLPPAVRHFITSHLVLLNILTDTESSHWTEYGVRGWSDFVKFGECFGVAAKLGYPLSLHQRIMEKEGRPPLEEWVRG